MYIKIEFLSDHNYFLFCFNQYKYTPTRMKGTGKKNLRQKFGIINVKKQRAIKISFS